MLTAAQKRCFDVIDAHIKAHGFGPSFEEIKIELGLKSKGEVHRLVSALVERGFVRRIAFRARALEIVRYPGQHFHCPDCDSQVRPEHSFCWNCGRPLRPVEAAAA